MKQKLALLIVTLGIVLGFVVQNGQAAGHSVTLTWANGTCTNCTQTGNNVKRSLTSGGPYTTILTSPSVITTYVDSSVAANTTYYYVVSATCSACTTIESANSAEVKAVVPADTQPAPPGTPTAVVQ